MEYYPPMEYIDRGGAIIARPIEIVRSELCSSTYLAARGLKQHMGAPMPVRRFHIPADR